jgi:hypothetical protein
VRNFEYARFNEQPYIKNKKIYESSPYKVHRVSEVIQIGDVYTPRLKRP